MIRVCRSGRNPTMRHLLRTHAVSVASLHEVFKRPDISLEYVQSERQADIYTKAFDNGDKWRAVCTLIGVYDVASFRVADNIHFWANPPPTKAALRAQAAEAESAAAATSTLGHGRGSSPARPDPARLSSGPSTATAVAGRGKGNPPAHGGGVLSSHPADVFRYAGGLVKISRHYRALLLSDVPDWSCRSS